MSCWNGKAPRIAPRTAPPRAKTTAAMIALASLLACQLMAQIPKPNVPPSAQDPKKDAGQAPTQAPTQTPKTSPTKNDSPESLLDPATGTWRDPNKQPEYRVGVGDSLSITVWKEPEVSGEVNIRGDCRITIQLIKDLEVCNFTPTEIQDLVADRLSNFYQITVADVTVVLRSISSRKVYFLGSVKRPGGMVLNGPITIAQALNDAGGLAEFANDKKVVIMRMKEGKWVRYVFNYRNYIHGKSTEGNMLLEPGDQIIVK